MVCVSSNRGFPDLGRYHALDGGSNWMPQAEPPQGHKAWWPDILPCLLQTFPSHRNCQGVAQQSTPSKGLAIGCKWVNAQYQ